jgi:hypothetical protein
VHLQLLLRHHQLLEALLLHDASQVTLHLESLEPTPYHLLDIDDGVAAFLEIVILCYSLFIAFEECLDAD